ncbi:MAG: extracellular solute-binding protein [Desulfitobacteriaceae bacterium]
MKKSKLLASLVVGLLLAGTVLTGCGSAGTPASNDKVTITYWQYFFDSKKTAMDELIKKFEAENPNITVVQQTFPYDQFNQKLTAGMEAGQGPDVVNLYYGWLPKYVDQGYLQPIPDKLMTTKDIDDHFIGMVKDSKLNDKYYALPTAVRTLALFWNKDLFKAAGLDPNTPPATWDEVLADARKLTKRDAQGNLQQEGYAWNVSGQDYHLFQEVFLRQWGQKPFSDDNKKVLWNASPAGYDAFQWWIDMAKKDKVGDQNFLTDYSSAFLAGKAAIMTDGSFRLPSLKKVTFNWGVAPLPVKTPGGEQATFGSFWANGITKNVAGAKLDASIKFIKFLSSDDTMRYWLTNVGEVPASKILAADPKLQQDPVNGAFVKTLSNAHATFFVDETPERKAIQDAVDSILLKNADPKATFDQLVAQEQKIRDVYYAKHQ